MTIFPIRAKAKYETPKGTILHVLKLSKIEQEYLEAGNRFEYYYPHEHDGKLPEGTLKRNLVTAKEIEYKKDGIYIKTELDVKCLSTARAW